MIYNDPQIRRISLGLHSSNTRLRLFGIVSAIPSRSIYQLSSLLKPSFHCLPSLVLHLCSVSRRHSHFIARGWLLFITRILSTVVCCKITLRQSDTFLSAQKPQIIFMLINHLSYSDRSISIQLLHCRIHCMESRLIVTDIKNHFHLLSTAIWKGKFFKTAYWTSLRC